ncbi:MAG: hypothetical protein AAB723_01525 [Patescibacteria group bacterium]
MPEDSIKKIYKESLEESPDMGPETEATRGGAPIASEAETTEKEKALIEHQLEDYAPQGQATPTSKDDDKVKVLQEAEKVREIKVEGRKIEYLLGLVEKNGVPFAVKVAKKTKDACLLDLFHDELVKQKLRP